MAAALSKGKLSKLKREITTFTKIHSPEEQKRLLDELDEGIKADVQEILERIENISTDE